MSALRSARSRPRILALLLGLLGAWAATAALLWRFLGPPAESGPDTVGFLVLINIHILLLLLLLFLCLRNLAKLAFERRRGVAGARLRTRLVLAFLSTTVIPTALLFLASAGFLARSIDSWFSERVEGALRQSLEVARAYYRAEEERALRAAHRVAQALGAAGPESAAAREWLPRWIQDQGLAGAYFVRPDGSTGLVAVPEPGRAPAPSGEDLAVRAALEGREGSRIVRGPGGDVVRGAAPLFAPGSRKVRGAVVVDVALPGRTLERMEEIIAGFEEYRQLQVLRNPVKASYILPLLLVALLVVFAAIWFGFNLARGITGPIQQLVEATQRVAGGDLDFELSVPGRDEVGMLVASFNRMTRDLRASKAQVEQAQKILERTNAELEQRRRYMEIVLNRVTAGVLSTDPTGRITTVNPAARELLGIQGEALGKPLLDVLPPSAAGVVEELVADLGRARHDTVQRQVVLDPGDRPRTVMVHLTRLRDEEERVLGLVAVLDDLTDLVQAQRARAWQEVARRMAHEIKNPLTPIQLSAQRLRRRYAWLLEREDGAVLDDATRTIVAQVEGLKRLVNAFTRFARMPESRPAPDDLNRIVGEVVALYRPAHPEIRFHVDLDPGLPAVYVDAEQMRRVCVNLLDNAVAAVDGVEEPAVAVRTGFDPARGTAVLEVADNGPGLSPEARSRLFEPYFSTKEGGTGLGLAIVKSVVAEHKGTVRAEDHRPRGTRFLVEIPVDDGG